MKKESRLATLVLLLKASKRLTAHDLSRKLQVTVRTVYRDIDTLISVGVPIRSIPGPTGGFILEEHFPIDPFVYSSSEELFSTDAIGVSLPGESATISSFDSAVQIISATLPEQDRMLIERTRSRYYFDSTNWFWREREPTSFPDLKEAVFRDKVVNILYRGRSDPTTHSDLLDPYGFVWRQGHWYIVGYSRHEEQFVRHRLQRILGVKITRKEFARKEEVSLSAIWTMLLTKFGLGEIRVRLRIEWPATTDFENFRWKDQDIVRKHADHMLAEMYVDNYEWLVPLVLSYGDKIEVLEPPSLRERIQQTLYSSMQRYT